MTDKRHRGVYISAWIPPELFEKLKTMSARSGLNRSEVLKRLIAGKKIPDKSYDKTLSFLAQLGGLLKHKAQGNQDIYATAQKILAIAHALQRQKQ